MNKVKTVFIAIGSVLSSLLGVLYIPVLLLVICNVIDYITGIFAAISRGEKISSAVGFKGIMKKVCMWLLVVVGVIIDELIRYATETIGFKLPFVFLIACIVAIWIVCNELISILENIKSTGTKVPPFFDKILYYIKDKTEETVMIDFDEKGKDDVE